MGHYIKKQIKTTQPITLLHFDRKMTDGRCYGIQVIAKYSYKSDFRAMDKAHLIDS